MHKPVTYVRWQAAVEPALPLADPIKRRQHDPARPPSAHASHQPPHTPGRGRRAGVFRRGRAGYSGGAERGASHVTTPYDLLTHAQCRQRVGPPSITPRYRRRFSYTRILVDLIVLVFTVHRHILLFWDAYSLVGAVYQSTSRSLMFGQQMLVHWDEVNPCFVITALLADPGKPFVLLWYFIKYR